MTDDGIFIDSIHGGKVEKGTDLREGFKPTAPETLTLPKPTPAPPAPQKGENKG